MMSRSATPSDFMRSMTAVERWATSAVAAATVGDRISAPSRTIAVSGLTATRPVPRAEISRGGAGPSAPTAGAHAPTTHASISTATHRRSRPVPPGEATRDSARPGGPRCVMARSTGDGSRRSRAPARQPRRLRAGALHFVIGLGCPRSEILAAGVRYEDVVLGPHADPPELRGHVPFRRSRPRLFLVLQGLGRGGTQPVAALPRLHLAVLAEIERDPLALGIEVEAGLHSEDHPRLEQPRLMLDAIVADVVDVHPEPVAGAMHVELPV